ncbi:MAG: MATE family efflux transporter [Candidatus Saelkia tenebricola]|nr:MATE family efflux transporter [Candidatus Saelkia tenebricola]
MRDFTKGNILKSLILFSLPIIIGDILQGIYTIVDAVWVGRLIGYEALAAVSASTPLIFFLLSLIIGINASTNILVAQSFGAKNNDLLSKVLTNSFLTVGVSCVFISCISIIFARNLLKIINTPVSIMEDAYIYLIIILGGLILQAAYYWFSVVLRGLGNSKTPLILLCMSVVLNIVITPLLIVGVGPLPELGIAGSALGTVISTLITTVIGYIYLIRKNQFLDIANWHLKFDKQIIKKIFSLGIPISFQMFIKSLSALLLVALVNTFGPAVIATYGIGIRLDMFAFMPALSIGIAVSSMVAQNLGARRIERVPTILKWALLFSLCIAGIVFAFLNIFSHRIAALFTQNPEVVVNTIRYISIVSFGYILFAIMFSFHGVIRGAGDIKIQLLFTFISLIVFRIPFAYFLANHTMLKEAGIWIAIPAGVFVATVLNLVYYLSGRWKHKMLL